mgnify:CR=1 FL=1
MSTYESHVGSDDELGARARAVRRRVFVDEQGVPEAVEMDEKDADATHVLLTDGDPVATARYRFVDAETAKIERVAVLRDYRDAGLGRRVMTIAERRAVDDGATTARLHAQERVLGFYESLGYRAVGDRFEEAGIPHRAMVKRLSD